VLVIETHNLCTLAADFDITLALSRKARGECSMWRVLYVLQNSLGTFIGAFGKLRKVTVSFFMSVRLSIRPHGKLGFHCTDFPEIEYLKIFRKYGEKIKVSLKSDNNDGRFS